MRVLSAAIVTVEGAPRLMRTGWVTVTVAIGPRVIGKKAPCFTHRFGEAGAEVCTAGDNLIKRRCGVRSGSDDLA